MEFAEVCRETYNNEKIQNYCAMTEAKATFAECTINYLKKKQIHGHYGYSNLIN